MYSRVIRFTIAFTLAAATGTAATTYTPSPAGFDTNGGIIKMQMDVLAPRAIVVKGDGKSFQKVGTMKLYLDGGQIGNPIAYGVQQQVTVPFVWTFTGGTHLFFAKAYSSDGSVFQSGTIVVTATTPTMPVILSAAVSPLTGIQSTTPFQWTATAKNTDGKSFSMTLWIVQPNGVPVPFAMTPISGTWAGGMTFSFSKMLISAGAYSFYVIGSSGGGQSRVDRTGPTSSINVWPRMTADTFHVGVHLYNDKTNLQKLRDQLHIIKTTVPGTAYTTCFLANGRRAQLSVQLDFRFRDYVDYGVGPLDDAIRAALAEGFAVHLLLSVHDPLPSNYGGYPWPSWPGQTTFVPYQPAKDAGSGSTMCPYDVAGLLFHKPVIQHLVGNGLADRVAVIYLLNEFDYRSDYSNAEAWPNCTSTPQQCRDEALAYTTNRVLATGRTAAAGHVPVGVKLPATTDSRSAFRRPATGKPDQLAWLLGTVMGPNKDILGYDAYWWPTNAFDIANRDRLAPWLGSFANGRFELSEYGRACESNGPCQFNADNKSGRTTPIDIRDLSKNWPTAGGFNLFAFNATGSGGCFAIYVSGSGFCTTGGNTGVTGQAELQALSQQINTLTGSTSPQPCQ